MTNDCAVCHAPGSYLERLKDSWFFCNACARRFVMDDQGRLIWTDTNHSPLPKVVEQDTAGVIVTGDS